MSRITKCVAAVVTALTCAGLGYAPSASAAGATPYDNLTQQGRLLDETGAPIDGIQLTFTFTLYDAATAGNVLWTENQSITPDKGYFSAKLGDTAALPAAAFDGSKVLFLGIKIGTDTEMAPRQAVTAVPFALRAREADHATSAATTPQATHANTADTATSANSTPQATHANTADSTPQATHAGTADTAGTVTSILSNFTKQTGSGATTASAACTAGTLPIGGGCSAGTALSIATFTGGKAAAGFTCTAASGTVVATAACAN